MNLKKRLIGIAATAVVATGIFAATAAPSDAAPRDHGATHYSLMDTGWT